MKKTHLFRCKTSRSRSLATTAFLFLAGMMGVTTTVQASATSASSYVPAERIPCSYGLSADDLKLIESITQTGTTRDVTVRVSIDEHGKISDAVVSISSGNAAFDNLALRASRRAQCMPYLGADGKAAAVETNFSFNALHRSDNGTYASLNPAANVSQPLTSANAANPSLLAAGIPFEFLKPFNPAALAKFGVEPGSPKEKIVEDWSRKMASDPDISKFFAAPPPSSTPSEISAQAFSRVLSLNDGMARISPEDRDRIMQMTLRELDSAPPDCGGAKNMQMITSHQQSLGTESDEAFRAQTDAVFNLIKQSTQSTPIPQVSAGQRLQGQIAVYASIADALKHDPAETEDLGLLLSGKLADLSPEAWCKAVRFYQHAFAGTPQPMRDWAALADLENQRRRLSVLSTTLKNLAALKQATQQSGVAPKLFDYPEMVRQRIRPNIVWSGNERGQEAVVEVHCKPSGNLETVKIVQSSGDPAWDRAALEAVKRSDPMPVDENGQAPQMFKITLRPGI